ncbi:MAG: hypothetical protein EOQ99_08215 [Mesorhizobium sp.]|nr:MAG: hypothetical protein EOQ99_08215 [Mesorhizobium sp.]
MRGRGTVFLGFVSAMMLDARHGLAQAPANWQTSFGVSASETKERIVALHDHILLIGVCIVALVAMLIGFALLRFRASRHPTASKSRACPGWNSAGRSRRCWCWARSPRRRSSCSPMRAIFPTHS